MAELRPYPFGALVRRAFRELERKGSIFDLPLADGFFGAPGRDLSVRCHAHEAATPFGPAAGPHSQLAQNIVLAWLAGGRIIELKTVQILDRLTIPRPCIDMQTIGFNAEWSQELSLAESLEEYVKAAMLVRMLVASGRLPLEPGCERTVFDMSVGYDLAGISSEPVAAFVRGLLDATPAIDRLRREIPAEHADLRDLPFASRVSDTLTLSTFHGCPPDEIERIVRHLFETHRLSCVVKLNPTLLGADETRRLLAGELGYEELRVPAGAFEKDTSWAQMTDFVGRLAETAGGLGLGFGVKFSNTLVVENHRDFFPAEQKEMYLSGPPLHVLAVRLVDRFRREFGDRVPVSFSAGVERTNFADAVALGLVPVTVCSDLLRKGGYARAGGYFRALVEAMRATGSGDLDDFVIRARGKGEAALARAGATPEELERCRRALTEGADLRAAAGPGLHARWLSEARLANTADYAAGVASDPRYHAERNRRPPRKIGRKLELFDCINCGLCVPVCPNDANFFFALPPGEIPVVKIRHEGGSWRAREEGRFAIAEREQIGNFADFCNDCGNCDVFCPEDGGPYRIKPRFFATETAWLADRPRDGFHVARAGSAVSVRARFAGAEYRLEIDGGEVLYEGAGFRLRFAESDPAGTVRGEAEGEVDLTYFRLMALTGRAVLEPSDVNYVNCL
jgi:putative selenate reductase